MGTRRYTCALRSFMYFAEMFTNKTHYTGTHILYDHIRVLVLKTNLITSIDLRRDNRSCRRLNIIDDEEEKKKNERKQ